MEERQLFTDHFSQQESDLSVYLIEQLGRLHPTSSLVATQDANFDLVKFLNQLPNNSDEKVAVLNEVNPEHSIKLIKFQPPKRRRETNGKCIDDIHLATYHVTWNGAELLAIVAKWREMRCGDITQWHLIGDVLTANDLILKCCTWCAELRDVILVFDRGFWRPDGNLWKAIAGGEWNDVILDDQLKSRLLNDYTSFFRSETMYSNLQVPWKRGIIFMGPPGNGKTITLKAIMKSVGVPTLYVKSFKNPNGDEFGIRQIFARARKEAPCLLVLEDLDSLITEENRSFFLNEVDGLEDNDGLLLIGTTNHFEKLDPALSSRPSRFDRKYNFPIPSLSERLKYAEYWQKKLSGNPKLAFEQDFVEEVAARTEGFSFAYLKEIFVSALLTLVEGPDGVPRGEKDTTQDTPSSSTFCQAISEQIIWVREQLETGKEFGMAASWAKSQPAGTTSGGVRGMRMLAFEPSD